MKAINEVSNMPENKPVFRWNIYIIPLLSLCNEPARNGIKSIIIIFTCRMMMIKPKNMQAHKKCFACLLLKYAFTKKENAVIAKNE